MKTRESSLGYLYSQYQIEKFSLSNVFQKSGRATVFRSLFEYVFFHSSMLNVLCGSGGCEGHFNALAMLLWSKLLKIIVKLYTDIQIIKKHYKPCEQILLNE